MNPKDHENRISGLDEIRSIACLLVLIGHLNYEMTRYFQLNISWKLFNSDKEGVTIFFTLSGFIITYRILMHYRHLRNGLVLFVKNRIWRILPLYFIGLITVSSITLVYNVNLFDKEKFIYYLLLIPNMLESGLPYLHHYWSLGVEEQFYIIYPLFMVLIFMASPKKQWFFVLAIFIILQVIRISFYFNEEVSRSTVNEFGFPFIMLGCFTTMLLYQYNTRLASLINNKVTQILALLILIFVFCINFNSNFFIHDVVSFFTAIIISGQALTKSRIIKIDNKFMKQIGKISFSIYVWHPIIIALCLKCYMYFCLTTVTGPISVILYIVIIALTIIVSHFSYKYIESYFYFNKKPVASFN